MGGANLVDVSFPAYLNLTLCHLLGVGSEDADSEHHTTSTPSSEAGLAAEGNNSTAPQVLLGNFGDAVAQEAYISACTSWRRQYHYDPHDHMDSYDDDMHYGYGEESNEYPDESYESDG